MSAPVKTKPNVIKIVPDEATLEKQALAGDPKGSAWVSANAGSGKTYVLSTRVIRLLLSGTDPSKILCLTYTKTAAAEMKNRVFSRLAEWATMPDAQLAKELAGLTGKQVSSADLKFSRTLFARALETPGGLKIQTIHAFCEALLHRFPLEANIAGHFELIDEMQSALLVDEARRQILTETSEPLISSVQHVLECHGESGLEKLLDEIVSNRLELSKTLAKLGSPQTYRKTYFAVFGFEETETAADVISGIWPLENLTREYAAESLNLLPEGAAKEWLRALAVAYDSSTQPPDIAEIQKMFLTKEGNIRSTRSLAAKTVQKTCPELAEYFVLDAENIVSALKRIHLLNEIEDTVHALTIAHHMLKLYSSTKNRRGFLDFDDLIDRTDAMFSKENIAAWVRYKLDQGIDHILIDEAQDTSPAQWRVVRKLADEFFDGEGARDHNRTVFAVGDEKQSIYSFQGADPREFNAAKKHFQTKAEGAQKPFDPVPLSASFRSTGTVLAAVDHVFHSAETLQSVVGDDGNYSGHRSLRIDQPGDVEVWDLPDVPDESEQEDWTLPVDHAALPEVVVAERITRRIGRWLQNRESVPASSSSIKAGDILILVRKRGSFVHALSRALKEADIPVAGADRLVLTDHIAVKDLMALGKIILNTADDLSLAALLRSPIFSWSDEQLFDLAHARHGALWQALAFKAKNNEADNKVFKQLQKWQNLSSNCTPFEFYSRVLEIDEVRKKLTGRLGAETSDMIDEFLNFALSMEKKNSSSLEILINTLGEYAPVIKREMEGDQDEVRIMTVHGAKGLEAPIVFLVDNGAKATGGHKPDFLHACGLGDLGQGFHWIGKKGERSIVGEQLLDAKDRAAEDEYKRLLYVGMTRAADRLIVAGYKSKQNTKNITWIDLVRRALEERSDQVDYDDFSAIRFPSGMRTESNSAVHDTEEDRSTVQVPACFDHAAPKEPPAPRPLIPSGASGLAIDVDRDDTSAEQSKSLLATVGTDDRTQQSSPNAAMLRGTIIHRLLQMLPAVPENEQEDRARLYCHTYGSTFQHDEIDRMCGQVFGILRNPDYAPFFDNDAHAEVSVMGTVDLGGVERAVSGVIDRLVELPDCVVLIDYKTNAFPLESVSQVPDTYLRQMALYHALVSPLYPEKPVRTVLLFTATPKLIELESHDLAAALESMSLSGAVKADTEI